MEFDIGQIGCTFFRRGELTVDDLSETIFAQHFLRTIGYVNCALDYVPLRHLYVKICREDRRMIENNEWMNDALSVENLREVIEYAYHHGIKIDENFYEYHDVKIVCDIVDVELARKYCALYPSCRKEWFYFCEDGLLWNDKIFEVLIDAFEISPAEIIEYIEDMSIRDFREYDIPLADFFRRYQRALEYLRKK